MRNSKTFNVSTTTCKNFKSPKWVLSLARLALSVIFHPKIDYLYGILWVFRLYFSVLKINFTNPYLPPLVLHMCFNIFWIKLFQLCDVNNTLFFFVVLCVFNVLLWSKCNTWDSSGKYCQVLNLINRSVPAGKVLTRAKIKITNFHSGSVRELPTTSRP